MLLEHCSRAEFEESRVRGDKNIIGPPRRDSPYENNTGCAR